MPTARTAASRPQAKRRVVTVTEAFFEQTPSWGRVPKKIEWRTKNGLSVPEIECTHSWQTIGARDFAALMQRWTAIPIKRAPMPPFLKYVEARARVLAQRLRDEEAGVDTAPPTRKPPRPRRTGAAPSR